MQYLEGINERYCLILASSVFVAFEAAKLIHAKPIGGTKIMSPHPSFSVG